MNEYIIFGWVLHALGIAARPALASRSLLAPSIPWLGRFPGDIRIEQDTFASIFPDDLSDFEHVAHRYCVDRPTISLRRMRWQPTSSGAITSSGIRKRAGSGERSRRK